MRKPRSKGDDQFAAADEFREFIDDVGELRLVGQEFQRDVVHRLGAGIDFAFRIDVLVQMAPGQSAIFHLDAGDFDDAVTRARVEARGFGIENNLAHGVSFLQFVDATIGQRIGAFIFRVGWYGSFDSISTPACAGEPGIEGLPQVGVLTGFVRGLPAIALPAVNPLAGCLSDILRIV